MAREWKLTVHGRAISKKNSRDTKARTGKRGQTLLFPGKSDRLKLFEKNATAMLQAQWDDETITDYVGIAMTVFYSGPEPDAFGPAETIFDCLEYARVVKNDRLLVPWGEPAIQRVRVEAGTERTEITLKEITV